MSSNSTSLVSLSPKCTEAIARYECHGLNEYVRVERNKRRVHARTFFKVISGLRKYKKQGKRLRWITLTVSPGNDKDFQRNWRKLIMRLRRKGLVKEYLRVPEKTKNGVRHEHILFLGKFIEQAYLSFLWKKITGDYVVWVSKVVSKTAQYLAKYASKCPEWRVSNSRCWVVRRLCGEWEDFKRGARELNLPYRDLYKVWTNATIQRVSRLWEYILTWQSVTCDLARKAVVR